MCIVLQIIITTIINNKYALLTGATLQDEREVKRICAGKEFQMPVGSTYSTVTFTPHNDGPKQVLLEETDVKDHRFTWTRDKTLILKEVTHSDQGLYAIKLFTGFTYEVVRLIVTECTKSYHRKYGENFEKTIPESGVLLDFSPRGVPPEAVPIVLWNRTYPKTRDIERGRLQRDGTVWIIERVTQDDQGNYTVRDKDGNVMSRSILSVRGHSFKVTRFTKESLNLPLFLPINHVHLTFTPTRHPNQSTLGHFDPKPPSGTVHLINGGQIMEENMQISLGRNGTTNEIIIAKLTSVHDGIYEIRDIKGNLVSSTILQVTGSKRVDKWRAIFKSISVPSGMFVSLTGLFLFLKHYPRCSLSQVIAGIRANPTPPANPLRVNIQDYSQPVSGPSGFYSHTQQPGTPRKWTPRASPTHTGYIPVSVGTPKTKNQTDRLAAGNSPHRNSTTEDIANEEDRRISFPVPGASDCLHSSEDCVQFQIKKDAHKERSNKSQEYFSILPLDTNTSDTCSVYISEKLDL
ncbi:hypothetical protein JOB18_018627 [Solea senegalensis]|uniref:Uncharacterized protein n=1 Tax=Solea senegalensis TaxID=28829 RepID=A0AAV6SKD9_SOLSE|nr:uncharacterized protein LOC122778432 isoform X2 [Solea senegalensis]KAG7517874.1 hypothetical protein JOB18_018627 [Solea senegalensis]